MSPEVILRLRQLSPEIQGEYLETLHRRMKRATPDENEEMRWLEVELGLIPAQADRIVLSGAKAVMKDPEPEKMKSCSGRH